MSEQSSEFETKWGYIKMLVFASGLFQMYFENTAGRKGGFKHEQYLWIRADKDKMDKAEKKILRIVNEVLSESDLQEAHGTSMYLNIAQALEQRGFLVRQQFALLDDPGATIGGPNSGYTALKVDES